ncbi:hypothetical protein WJX73_000753 [Symbiochloris irregularis]|uniref:Uncharacterized protein n=1 Tax=Symbiochloris irregularis TaxID=706552 RepID=A0AAW1P846_9CHLO
MGRWKPGQFPAGPPENYNPDDPYADPVALVEFREYAVRQKKVQVEKAKVLRQQLTRCYKTEGVNHFENCRNLRVAYMEAIKNVGVHRGNRLEDDKPVQLPE